ncbi:hypothetical protein [Chryseolinea lacunae]|uniref:XRE family transcriptional regulator n=1 Tax=Chryseolinea lacunae TaxID=2801331 RepID=A0ABS1KY68_9BACT|nr:hypothetical protein [Chryseolinea lacunae]MBL0744390.1 hypothetical protein [Chryseolinea lacunae]
MAKIKVKVEKTRTGFSAYAEKYAAFTTGKTVNELTTNMVEALNVLFEAEQKKKEVTKADITFEMDLMSIFEVYPVINMKGLSARVGMNYSLLAQYATGKKKPSSRQTALIMDSIHELGRELSELNLITR